MEKYKKYVEKNKKNVSQSDGKTRKLNSIFSFQPNCDVQPEVLQKNMMIMW